MAKKLDLSSDYSRTASGKKHQKVKGEYDIFKKGEEVIVDKWAKEIRSIRANLPEVDIGHLSYVVVGGLRSGQNLLTPILPELNEDVAKAVKQNIIEILYAELDVDFYDLFCCIDDFVGSWVREQFDKINKVRELIDLPPMKLYYEHRKYKLELHDNPTYTKITREDSELYYDYYRASEIAIDLFENATGVKIMTLGRSGRHVCVEFNENNFIKYDYLRDKALEYEQWLIDEVQEGALEEDEED